MLKTVLIGMLLAWIASLALSLSSAQDNSSSDQAVTYQNKHNPANRSGSGHRQRVR